MSEQGYGITWHVYRGAPCVSGTDPRECPGCRAGLADGALAPDLASVTPLPRRAELARDAQSSLARLPAEAQLAERVNPGRVIHVAVITDIDGCPVVIGADYTTVTVGGHRIERERMPELWAALGEAAWLAGTIEQQLRDEGALEDEDGDDGR